MNKRKAKALLASVQNSYVSAIKAFGNADSFSRSGMTTKALDERDRAMVQVRKAEAAIAELSGLIEVAT
jgi:hypothetical protein